MSEMQPEYLRRSITVWDFHRMGEIGIFKPDEHIELLDGLIISMPPMGERHWSLVSRIHRLLSAATAGRATVVSQLPIVLNGDSEPIPDITVARFDSRDYESRKPGVGDLVLLVEVADSSLDLDRTAKLRLYQGARVPAYWIVNARDQTVTVHRDPRPTGYRIVRDLKKGDSLQLPGFPDVLLSVDEIF